MVIWYGCTYVLQTLLLHAVPAPQIIRQPVNTTAAKPFGAHFTCTANGYGSIRILWKSTTDNGTTLVKATITEERSLESVTSTLFIPDVVLADEGGYYCTAWIERVSASSQTAYLKEIGMYIVTGTCKCAHLHSLSAYMAMYVIVYVLKLLLLSITNMHCIVCISMHLK